MPIISAKHFYLLILLNLNIVLATAAPRLFNTSWEERTPFKAGLIDSERVVLTKLPLATVYHIMLDITETSQISAKQEVRVFNKQSVPTEELYFYLFPNLLESEIILNKLELNGQPIIPTYENEGFLLRIDLPEPLARAEAATVYFEFALELPKKSSRNYNLLTFDKSILSLAHIYPTLAVQDPELGWMLSIPPPHGDMLFSESSFFLLQVNLLKDMILASTGQIIRSEKRGDKKLLTIAAGPVRDIFLAASRNFEIIETKVDKTVVRSYYLPSAEVNNEIIGYTVGALESFNTRFGQYPFTEFDLVPLPTFALGVEFPGIVGITSDLYTTTNQELLESVTVHEVAHQWFYSVLGSDQVNEPWLDEVLAQYATWLYYKDQYGKRGYLDFRNSLESRWAGINSAHFPIDKPVEYYSSNEYSSVIYGLGALVLESLSKQMGEVTFNCFLQAYYQNNKWGIVNSSDFFELAEKHCNCNVEL